LSISFFFIAETTLFVGFPHAFLRKNSAQAMPSAVFLGLIPDCQWP
jgi:hypothetical protein